MPIIVLLFSSATKRGTSSGYDSFSCTQFLKWTEQLYKFHQTNSETAFIWKKETFLKAIEVYLAFGVCILIFFMAIRAKMGLIYLWYFNAPWSTRPTTIEKIIIHKKKNPKA